MSKRQGGPMGGGPHTAEWEPEKRQKISKEQSGN